MKIHVMGAGTWTQCCIDNNAQTDKEYSEHFEINGEFYFCCASMTDEGIDFCIDTETKKVSVTGEHRFIAM